MTATLTITSAPGGRLPGLLSCSECGAQDWAIWEPTMGAACSACHQCFVLVEARILGKPGTYRMGPIPPIEALLLEGRDTAARRRKAGHQ